MSKITYENKVALNVNSDIADINKVNASDLNEIKNVVNENDDNTTNNANAIETINTNIGTLSNLNTTEKSNLVGAINSVVKSGSNTNGNYVKYADGTMICTKKVSGNTGATCDLWANNIYFKDITNGGNWAETFTNVYGVNATSNDNQFWVIISGYSNTSTGTIRIVRPDNGGSNQNYDIFLTAFGTWK